MITDDYSQFEVFVDGVKHKRKWGGFESDGYVSIMTLSEYKTWYAQAKKDIGDLKDAGVEGFFVPGFKGTIQVGAKLEEGGYVKNIDFSDFIQHQFEDCYDVFINLPAGTIIHDLNSDLTLPINVIRDQKINNLLQTEEDSSQDKTQFIEILLDYSRTSGDVSKVYMDMNKMRKYKPVGTKTPIDIINIIENSEYIDLTSGGRGDNDWWSEEEESMFDQGIISWDRPKSGLRGEYLEISFC
jgi:hypothetical protein